MYEAMLSPLSAVAGSLEDIFRQDDGAGTVCALVCTGLMNPDGPDGKLDEPCRNCLKEKQ